MRRFLAAAAALFAAALLIAYASAPPEHLTLVAPFADGTVSGAMHVHSTRSDGLGSPEEIARAAAEAGLTFVVLTDHGDATRAPDPPHYVDGVLLIDAVEISTSAGHYIALGMPAAPYPLAGEARDVAEDVARLGGFGIVAHPDSPKPTLAWRDWDVPMDGIELINLDTAWRTRVAAPGLGARVGLPGDALAALVRAPESIARLAREGDAARRWATLAGNRRIVIAAGTDAHGGLSLGGPGSGEGPAVPLPVPGYAAAFRALSVHVQATSALNGDGKADADAILAGIRAGHLYVALDGIATPTAFSFTADTAEGSIQAGDLVPAGAPISLHVRSNAPAGYVTNIWRGSAPLGASHQEPDFSVDVDGAPAVYRVTIDAPGDEGAPIPWILSNAIYVRTQASATPRPTSAPARAPTTTLFASSADAGRWRVETDPTSLAALDVVDAEAAPELRFRWGLPGAPAAQQYAALVGEAGAGEIVGDTLVFDARSDEPARLFVELRVYQPEGRGPVWRRSIYLDSEWRTYRLPFEEFTAPDGSRGDAPPAGFRSVMFVVNTGNTPPGASGRVTVRDVRTTGAGGAGGAGLAGVSGATAG